MSTVGLKARRELVRVIAERYRAATKLEKARILDEFVSLSGHHRKHAIRLLTAPRGSESAGTTITRPRIYDEAVRLALVVLWEAADRICGKRLKPLLPLLIPALERHGHLRLDQVVRSKLLIVGASTIDRLLAGARMPNRGRGAGRHRTHAVRGMIPIRTFADWGDPKPGFLEVDLVAHCGGSMAGSFVHTLTLTDIASGWTECVSLAIRESSLVVRALDRLRTSMPFPLRGIDTDNGGEFMNDLLLQFSKDSGIEFTRSRPYKKNDQAWVEQKNGSVVRRMVGYGRLEGLAASEALARLYDSSRLFVNFFQPSFKLRSKQRVGARVRKNYYTPETPCSRLLASEYVAGGAKDNLRAMLATLDPLRLLDEIRTMQRHIAGFTEGRAVHVPPFRDLDLDRFMTGLASAWKDGEVRATHKKRPSQVRYWRTRKDPVADIWPQVIVVLESEPGRTAKELLERFPVDGSEDSRNGRLRTLQRRVKDWRSQAARRLVFPAATN